MKTKVVRAHKFMTKALRKKIMTSSGLKNFYLKNQNTTYYNINKYQQNFCNNLLRKTKQRQNVDN